MPTGPQGSESGNAKRLPTGKPSSTPHKPTGQTVKYGACGCVRPLEKLLKGDCPTCRDKKKAEKNRKAKEHAIAFRSAERLRRADGGAKHRLPEGSKFDVAYNAAAEQWNGTLTIPSPDGPPLVLTDSAGGVFHLLEKLDTKFRNVLVAMSGINSTTEAK